MRFSHFIFFGVSRLANSFLIFYKTAFGSLGRFFDVVENEEMLNESE